MDLSSVFKYIFQPLLFLRLQALTSFVVEGVALRMAESAVTFFIEKLGNFGFAGSFSIRQSRRPDKATAARTGVDAALPEGCRFKTHIR